MSCENCTSGKWVYRLNETGALIWELCCLSQNIEELIDNLSQRCKKKFTEYEKNEIIAYIKQLEENELIFI